MDLKTFISTALKEICEGIRDARNHVNEVNGNLVIAPAMAGGVKQKANYNIDFDILVRLEETSDKSVEGGMKIAIFSVDASSATTVSTANHQRIKFSVPYVPTGLALSKHYPK